MPSVFAPSWLILSEIKMNMKMGTKGAHGGKYAEAQQKGGQERAVLGAPQRDMCKSNQRKCFLFSTQGINAFKKWKVVIILIHAHLLWTRIALLNLEIQHGYSEQFNFYRLCLKFWAF